MASSDIWSDFESFRHNIKTNTVDRLKQILSGLNDECNTHFSKSGKKQEIIDRIVDALDTWRAARNEDRWTKAKAVLNQVRNTGTYNPQRMSTSAPVHNPIATHNPYASSSAIKAASFTSSSSGIGRYDPYAPPRKATAATATTSTAKTPVIRFKPSPFFRIDQAISAVVECPESTSATDRRQQTVSFTLTPDQLSKLKTPGSTFQLRLFCTSSTFYSASPSGFRPNTGPCLIEFPPTCEVRVNNVQLTANLKGLKKKPGTAPPPDLGRYVRLTTAGNLSNRVEMVYVNSQQPVQSKKFYLVVMLVDITTVDELVQKLKKGKFQTSEEIRQKMLGSMNEDDDIIAGPQKMSLKCPLSFMRVTTPCRSSQCVHRQCFDATSWFSVMEQTTTWLCPVCERVLNTDDLVIDGYFDEILKQSPESVEDVVVEANGEWHTTDNKYASANWKATHPVKTATELPHTPRKAPVQAPSSTPTKAEGKARANDEIVILDSDDEDEGRVKRELSLSYADMSSGNLSVFDGPSVPQSQLSQIEDVIDLTLDSDDEEPPIKKTLKRKASNTDDGGSTSTSTSQMDQTWKKGRFEHSLAVAAMGLHPGSSSGSASTPRFTNGSAYHPHLAHQNDYTPITERVTLPPPRPQLPAAVYGAAPFARAPLPPAMYPTFEPTTSRGPAPMPRGPRWP